MADENQAAPAADIQTQTPVDTTAAPAVDAPAQADIPADPAPADQAVSTLLADDAADKKEDAATVVEAPKEGEPAADAPKEEQASQSDEPAPLPTYEPFTLPEGIEVDNETLAAFTTQLGEFERNTGADHAATQAFGQTLMERHIAALNDHTARLQEYYQNAWDEQKNGWAKSFESDPEIGGNRRDTTLKHAKTFIRTYGGDEAQQKELTSLMNDTGIGNHPALIRLLSRAGESLAEGRPLPATNAGKGIQSKVAKRYGQQQ